MGELLSSLLPRVEQDAADLEGDDRDNALRLAGAPATFNTINERAQGISDTLALGLLNEAIGLALPVVAVPVPNLALARHPSFQESVERLRTWGVRLLFDPQVYPLPTPNMGPPAAQLFPWEALAQEIGAMRLFMSHPLNAQGQTGPSLPHAACQRTRPLTRT